MHSQWNKFQILQFSIFSIIQAEGRRKSQHLMLLVACEISHRNIGEKSEQRMK